MGFRLYGIILFVLLVGLTCLAGAAEPNGCDKFAWPLEHERQLLLSPDKIPLGPASKRLLDRSDSTPISLALTPFSITKFDLLPERAPKSTDSFADLVHFSGAAKPGIYKLNLSDAAWVDVVQNGKLVRSTAFTGATGCAGIRKSVKFELGTSRFTVQISNATKNAITLLLTPDN